VDISGVTSVDQTGADLVSYMRESGVRLTAPPPLASPEIARSLGIPVAVVVPPTDRRRVPRSLAARLARLFSAGAHR
jgi:hypothetical protein